MNARLSKWLVALAVAGGSPIGVAAQPATDADEGAAMAAPGGATAQDAAPSTEQAAREERVDPRSGAPRSADRERAAAAPARVDRRPSPMAVDRYLPPLPRGSGYDGVAYDGGLGYGHGAGYGYPSPAVNAVPPAQARATAAYLQYQQALDDLDYAVRSVQRRFANSEPMRRATAAERRAWAEYEAARTSALETLTDDADYQAVRSLKQDLDERIRAERQVRRPNMLRIVALAKTKLNYAMLVSRQEQTALGQAGNVQQARQRFVQAASQTQELRQRFDRELLDNPQLAEARRRVADARIAYQAAESYLDGLEDARDIALDYAYDRLDESDYAYGHYPPYYRNYPAWWLGQ